MSTYEHYITSIIQLASQLPRGTSPYSLSTSEVWCHAASSSGPIEHWPESHEDLAEKGPGFFHELVTAALERMMLSADETHINTEKVLSSLSLKLVDTPEGEALRFDLTPPGEETFTDYVAPGRFTVELTRDKLSMKRVRRIEIDKVLLKRPEPSP